jgi:hypothetical protein
LISEVKKANVKTIQSAVNFVCFLHFLVMMGICSSTVEHNCFGNTHFQDRIKGMDRDENEELE